MSETTKDPTPEQMIAMFHEALDDRFPEVKFHIKHNYGRNFTITWTGDVSERYASAIRSHLKRYAD